MLTSAERVLLLKILGLLSSPVAGERAAAGWKACELVQRAGGWDAVISTSTVPEVPESFLGGQDEADVAAAKERAAAIRAARRRSWTNGLTDLEVDFMNIYAGLDVPTEVQKLFYHQIQDKIRANRR